MGLLVQASILALVLALISPLTHALGLGEVKLNSNLYQPLDAEIQLLQTRDLSGNEIIVTMAPREAFDRAGVEKTYFVTALKFKVDMDNASGPVVRITSKTPVKEPFLNFLVQAQWPSGKLLREYTLLMDLPVFSEEKAAPVTAAKKAPLRQEVSRPQPRQQQPQPRTASPRVTPSESGDGEVFGPVRSSDTLWAIASENRPGSDVSIHKTMVAIQRLNPSAFINGNINLLKKGQILRLPSRDDIDGLSQREAVSAVVTQTNQWRSGDSEVSDAQLTASPSFERSTEEAPAVEGRVKLSSVGTQDASLGGRGSGDEPSSTEALETRLSGAKEELNAAKLENAELKDRISDMQESIGAMEKLISLHSEDMAKLEQALAENERLRKAMEEARANGTVPEVVESDIDVQPELTEEQAREALEENVAAGLGGESDSVVSDEGAAELEAGAEPATDEVATEEVAEAEVQAPPVAEAPAIAPAKSTIMDLVMENLLYIAGGLVVFIGIIVYFLLTRSNGFDEDEDFEYEEGLDAVGELSDDETTDTVIAPFSAEISDDDSELVPQGAAEEDAEVSHQPQTDDVAGEADIHIAYSDFETAERLLLTAMETDPQNTTNHLKLLEVYSRQSDLAKFDTQYAALHNYADQESLDRAAQLRGYIEDAPEFDPSVHVTGAALAGAALAVAAQSESTPDDSTLEFEISTPAADDTLSDDLELSLDDLESELTLDDELSFDDSEDAIVAGLDISSDEPLDAEASPTTAFVADTEDDFNISLDEALSDDEFSLDSDELGLGGEAGTDEELDIDLGDAVLGLDLEGVDESALDSSDGSEDEFDVDLSDVEIDVDGDDLNLSSDDLELDGADLDFSSAGIDLGDETSLLGEGLDVAEDSAGSSDLPSLSDDELMGDEQAEASEGVDLNFDDLDKDLDALASDFDGDLGDLEDAGVSDDFDAPDALIMEEPVTEFDGLDLEEGTDAAFEEIDEGGVDLGDLVDLDSGELGGAAESSDGLDLAGLDASVEGLSDDALVTDDADDLVIPGLEDSSAPLADISVGLDDLSSEMGELDLTAAAPSAAEAAAELGVEEDAPKTLAEKPVSADAGADFELPDFDPDTDDDSDLGFLSDRDELSTKLDLLRVFVDMGDSDSAMHTYEEIKEEGTDEQKREAEQLVSQLD